MVDLSTTPNQCWCLSLITVIFDPRDQFIRIDVIAINIDEIQVCVTRAHSFQMTGEEKWATSELGSGQFIYIEPYFLSIDIKGSIFLSLPSPEKLKIIASIQHLIATDNAKLWTKPVTAQGNLYLRYANRIYCYRLARG